MTDLMANVSYGAMLAVGLLLICGFLLIANARDARNAKHPGGARGRVLDELLVMAPAWPAILSVTFGGFVPPLRDQSWWPYLSLLVLVGALAFSFAPPVKRARQRLAVMRGDPAQ